MKKIYFLLALLFTNVFCYAQHYQCLQSGVKHYFIDEANYLRGIRIDSITVIGDSTIYYPYRTTRSDLNKTGSWLGGRVIQLPEGTFLFDDLWNDTVTIKPQANIGDSWLFYSDTTNRTYIATVTGMDTMTVLGTLDSVKSILIQSYHSGAIDSTDPINGFSITLSENNGFVKVFDLYTFPYYSPSGASCDDRYFHYVGSEAFNIIDYQTPTTLKMYNFNVGDMFAGNYATTPNCPYEFVTNYTHYDSIIYKAVIDSFHVNYAVHHLYNGVNINSYYGGFTSNPFTEDFIDTLRTDTSLVFLKDMPEEYTVSETAFSYYPNDTAFCFQSPAYKSTMPWLFEGCPLEADFKQGFLQTYATFCTGVPCPEMIGYPALVNNIMYYALVGGNSCGSVILPPLAVNNVTKVGPISIFPNPAWNDLNISAPDKIRQVYILNTLGQVLYSAEYNVEKVQLNVSNLSPGLYYLKINNRQTLKFIKQ